MQYTPLQIEIIRIFGRKELSFGCIVKFPPQISYNDYTYFILKINDISESKGMRGDDNNYCAYFLSSFNKSILYRYLEELDFEILGHIPHLEDVFRVAEEKGLLCDISSNSSSIRLYDEDYTIEKEYSFDGTIPLIEQSEDTLNQLITLFK